MTRGEYIFNNKIYIGDLASIYDVRCPAAKYRGEYQEVPATLSTSQRRGGESKKCERRAMLFVVFSESRATEGTMLPGRQTEGWSAPPTNKAAARGCD